MAKSNGVSISIAADTSSAAKAIQQGIIEPLEDTLDVLDGFAKEGDQAGDKIEAAMEAAQKETDGLADKQKELRDALDKTGKQGRKSGEDLKDGFNRAEKGAEEFKDEANSTAREAAASFDGSAESIGDAFQEVAANAFAGFGPAGALAGLGIAAGLGTAFKAFEDMEAQSQEAKERIAALGEAMIDAGSDGQVPLELIIENLKAIVLNAEDAARKFSSISYAAKQTGLDASKLAQAYAGSEKAIQDQIEAVDELIAKEKQSQDNVATGGRRFAGVSDGKLKKLEEERRGLVKLQEEINQAAKAEQDYLANDGAEFAAKESLIQSLNDAYDDAAGSVENFIDEESGIFNVEEYIKAMQKRETALRNYQTNLATAKLSPQARQFLNEQGVEAAASLLQGYMSATPAQQQALARYWTEAGKTSSGQYVRSFTNTLPDHISKKPLVQVQAEVAELERTIQKTIDKNTGRTIYMTVIGKDRQGRAIF